MKKFLKIILFITGLAVNVFLVCCSPQKRLNNLVSNNPELVKTDTIYKTKEILLPAIAKDSSSSVSEDIFGLYAIIDSLGNGLEAFSKEKLKTELKNYVTNRNCLDSPITISIPGGGYLKVWQDKGKFNYSIRIPEKKTNISVPVVVMRVEAVNHYNWGMFTGGFFFCLLMVFCGILLFKFKFLK